MVIILFDGECHVCDKSVEFIIKRDPDGYFHFASLQSEVGQNILNYYRVERDIDSLVLIDHNQYYQKSTAALKICRNLKGLSKFLYILLIIPLPIRDFFYKIIVKNRYRWFGKKNICMLPLPNVKKRFLD
jgi:predicted DCC family thiol-disulfide oxidoreductase YuxK